MHRSRTGKRIEITSRDIEIFKLLDQYRYLRSTYIHAFVGGASGTRFKERLGDLFHEGFIDRPERQWDFANARYLPAVHEIGKRAKEALEQCGAAAQDPRTFLASSAHRQFQHSVLICECLASIELAARLRGSPRFIPWPETIARAPEAVRASATPFRIPVSTGSVVPDGFFGLEYQGSGSGKAWRFFALEVDRGTMPIARTNGAQTSYLAKLAAYQEVIDRRLYKSHLGVPNLFVLTITTGEHRLAEIRCKFGAGGPSPLFLFKAVDEHAFRVPQPDLLTGPWPRANAVPLAIAESR